MWNAYIAVECVENLRLVQAYKFISLECGKAIKKIGTVKKRGKNEKDRKDISEMREW